MQLYTKAKSFDCQKAERFFKERQISLQKVDLLRDSLSGRALDAVARAVGLKKLIDTGAKSYEKANLRYLTGEASIKAALSAHPDCFAAPIVRYQGKATVGYCPEVWLEWIKNENE